jgi:hypothetical protein
MIHEDESIIGGECFITKLEFNRFKKEIGEEFERFRTIMEMQQRQIQQLGSNSQTGSEEAKNTIVRNRCI